MKYCRIENYVMKCRMYPNKSAQQRIDEALRAAQSVHNCVIYDLFNGINVTEKEKKSKESSEAGIVHFPDWKKVESAAYINELKSQHPIMENVPTRAITCKSGILANVKKSLGKLPVEYQKPVFHNARHPLLSYSYQEGITKFKFSENPNVMYTNLCRVGIVKVRGMNKHIRFDEEGVVDFKQSLALRINKALTITVSKDHCGDYWLCFKLPFVYKPVRECGNGEVGIDAGVTDIAILSTGKKYSAPRFKKAQEKRLQILGRRLSRRQGWANIKFREAHKKDKDLLPSNSYAQTLLKIERINRKIGNQRADYNNKVSSEIIADNAFIGIESLDVKGMLESKKYSKGLSDAAMSQFLSMIKYKGEWYGRRIVPIGQFIPSTKTCSVCGYVVKDKMPPTIRRWTCPDCGTKHDRDVNAAVNILNQAKSVA